MVRKKRKNRDILINEGSPDLNKPMDIESLGSNDDPCFGKFHDLKAIECKACGDKQFCAIVTQQNIKQGIIAQESEQRFKDIEEAKLIQDKKISEAKVKMAGYIEDGLRKTKIILKISNEFKLDRDTVRNLYKNFE